MFGPLHERAEYQVIVYSYTKLTLFNSAFGLASSSVSLKKFSVQQNFHVGLKS